MGRTEQGLGTFVHLINIYDVRLKMRSELSLADNINTVSLRDLGNENGHWYAFKAT